MNLTVCKYQKDLPCTTVQILDEVTSVQTQTTKQVNLVAEDQFRDGNEKAAILDLKKKFLKSKYEIFYVYDCFKQTFIALWNIFSFVIY